MSVSYIHCQFSTAFPGSATLQRGFWSRAGARRSQGRTLVQDLRNGHLAPTDRPTDVLTDVPGKSYTLASVNPSGSSTSRQSAWRDMTASPARSS